MKFYLHECYIAWNPGTDNIAQVALVPKEKVSTIHGVYRYFWGISTSELAKLIPAEVKHLVLAQALNLIVNYRCDPHAVHQVLLELEEYIEGWVDLFTHNLGPPVTE